LAFKQYKSHPYLTIEKLGHVFGPKERELHGVGLGLEEGLWR
jgi:hypothetical protein